MLNAINKPVNNFSRLPVEIRVWLNNRGISHEIIEKNRIGFDGKYISIPVMDKDGAILFYKYRRSPALGQEYPKYKYEKNAHVALYGIRNLSSDKIIICEGEFDQMILESKGFHAVTSTGGAGTFKEEWIPLFAGKEVFVCLDNDEAGRRGIERICRMMPRTKNIPLPAEVGEKGDITDYFVKLNKTAEDFSKLMAYAFVPVFETKKEPAPKKKKVVSGDKLTRAKAFPIGNLIKVNSQGFARCLFHQEKTGSLKIYKDNKFKCFGCGKFGDVIDIAKEVFGIDTKEAINKLS